MSNFCLALSLLAGCSNPALLGTYTNTGSDQFVQVDFEFKRDSVLEVTFWSEMSGESKKIRKWYAKGDTVYTPNELATGSVFNYKFVKEEAVENFQIYVFDKQDMAGINVARITLNDDAKPLKLLGNGLYQVEIPKELIEIINVKYLSQQHEIQIDLNEMERYNKLEIYFDFINSMNDFAYSPSWVRKDKRLYSLDSGHQVLIRRK